MKSTLALRMAWALVLSALLPSLALAWPVQRADVKKNNDVFQRCYQTHLTWHLETLPKKASVPKYRMPYAGYIYPDKIGGCEGVLWKYDQAFHGGRGICVGWERNDIAIHKERPEGARGWMSAGRLQTPDWAGHCNGWTAAAIRHAEPQKSVTRNGVTFTPADIKGLMAELYVYSEVAMLGGENKAVINPAMLHVIITNWIGLGEHPLGMDVATGKEIWNYPVYAYSCDYAKQGRNRAEVRTNIAYVYMLDQEYHRAPKKHFKIKQLHYSLDLNNDGEIIGGDYFGDSERVDIAWVPMQATTGGTKGNEAGCPHLSPREVLSMWREATPLETRKQWWNIDPTKEDGVVETDHPLLKKDRIFTGRRPVVDSSAIIAR